MRSIALILFTLAVVCSPTRGAPPPKLDITFTIPKDYTGILVMAFDMPGGLIFDKEYDIANAPSHLPESITVDFDLDGLARIGRQTLPFGDGKQIVVERETNKEIPLVFRTQDLSHPLPPRAALTDGGTLLLLKGRKEFGVRLFLVGDPSKFPAIFDHKQHAVQIAATLAKHFGLPVTPESLCPSDKKK
jgi:hypothetical protein